MTDAPGPQTERFLFTIAGDVLRIYALANYPESKSPANFVDIINAGWQPVNWSVLDDAEKRKAQIPPNELILAIYMKRAAQQN
jgi:hypothetical protein